MAKATPFTLSNGTKIDIDTQMRATQPNLKYARTCAKESNPFLTRGQLRTEEDNKRSAEFLASLRTDLTNFVLHIESNNQMTPYAAMKTKAIANSERILDVCDMYADNVDKFNLIVRALNAASEAEDLETFVAETSNLRKLISASADSIKFTKSKTLHLGFLSVPRALAAGGFNYMQLVLAKANQHANRMQMSPAQRKAAEAASTRMKLQWLE